jgi:hypothetical protein
MHIHTHIHIHIMHNTAASLSEEFDGDGGRLPRGVVEALQNEIGKEAVCRMLIQPSKAPSTLPSGAPLDKEV